MYTKDKTIRVTFRCDDKLSDWLKIQSDNLGLTPSAYVRQILFAQMAAQANISLVLEKTISKLADDTLTSSEKAVSSADHIDHK